MKLLTLEIAAEMDAALQAESRRRGISTSALVCEAIEQALGPHAERAAAAAHWISWWRGRLAVPDDVPHLLGKHLR